MGLTPEEAFALSDEAWELGQAIGQAFSKDSPGGRRMTKKERRGILRKLTHLAWVLARDLVD